MSLQSDRLQVRKSRIVDVARRLITNRSYEGIRMRELQARAGTRQRPLPVEPKSRAASR